MSSRALPAAVLASLGTLAVVLVGCQDPRDLAKWTRSALTIPAAQAQTVAPQPGQAQAPVAVAVPIYAAQAPRSLAEQPLDTRVDPRVTAPPAPQQVPAPVVAPANKNRKVRTVSDEHLPSWVPVSGRLTVVESSDLAENLGLVPQGTTKKTEERISVAEKLAEENAARAAARPADPIVRGVSWNFSAPRARGRR